MSLRRLLAWRAALAAVVAFLSSLLVRRRRPEVKIHWQFLDDGAQPLRAWLAEEVPILSRHQPLQIRVRTQNVGDAVAEHVLTNFIAPDVVALESLRDGPGSFISTNATAGVWPEKVVTCFWKSDDLVVSGDWFNRDYELRLTEEQEPCRVRVLFVVSCASFNTRGARWLPSFSFDVESEPDAAPVGSPWPPRKQHRRLRRVRSLPKGRVCCGAGGRSDVRDIDILA